MPSNFKALAGASGGEPTDANFKNVTLLLHGDGSNGAQNNTFLDSSTNNFTITRNGNTTQGSFSPYGSNWSNYFDGNGDYLSLPTDTALSFGTGDWTIEAWIFPTSSSGNRHIFSGADVNGLALYLNTSGKIAVAKAGVVEIIASTTTIAQNTYTHVAASRSGNTFRIFVNGTLEATVTSSQDFTGSNANKIGFETGATAYQGYISNLRILKGTALYTSTFTPSTTPLTAITNTSLLTCQSNRFRDASTNNFTITRNGDVKVTNFAPFAPSAAYSTTTNGGSAYFDGSGDYLTSTSANTANAMGTGDWTVEGWVYRTSGAADMVIFDTVGISAGSADYIRIFVNTGGGVSFWKYSTATTTTTSAMPIGAWSHFAVVRQSGSIKIYVNGVQGNTTYTDTGSNYTCSASRPAIGINGFDASSNPYAGYVSNIRTVKGTAVYTANFTPPTSPVTSISGTGLLLNATNAAIFDNSMKNDLETVGNAQISTSVKKFGTGSMAFDGSGDFITMPSTSDLSFGSGNFTIEGWVYRVGGGRDQVICDFRSGTGTTIKPCIFINSSNQLIYLVNGSAVIVGGTIAATTWTHVALSKSGSSTKMFINGTQTGSTYTDTNDYGATSRCYLGADDDGGQNAFLNGYIDDLRVTKGVARYTANFTPPTAAFPNK